MQDSLHMIRATLKVRLWLLLWLFNTTNLIKNFDCVLQQLRIPFKMDSIRRTLIKHSVL